jgi:hypothetical protein
MTRDLFAREALAQIPKLLTLLDRNPHSPTYGCFDRNYWQYKIIDFPSGMAQEFCWPLALAHATPLPGNSFYGMESIRDWVRAAITFAASSSHRDGSCDDYFPYERAGGAAAFSLLAMTESCELMGIEDPGLDGFLARRADWLAHHLESGRLTNHQALIVLCLERLGRRLKSGRWDAAKRERLETVLSWQDAEGWFVEYEGCDPGYHTLTISCLAAYHAATGDARVEEALRRAVRLAAEFVHPDGSFGGEYTSRNTYNFFPHGFELVGRWMPEALTVNDRFLRGLEAGLAPCYADDHIIGHHTWNYLLAWRDFAADRPPVPDRPTGRVWLRNAGILIDRRDGRELYLALNKGGCFKCFVDGRLAMADTHLSLRVRAGGAVRNAIGHLVDTYDSDVGNDRVTVRGSLGWAKQKLMNPLNLMILRVVMLSVGRFFPNLIRKLLQKLLITGKKRAPFRFEREFAWEAGRLVVRDRLQGESWAEVEEAGWGGDQTSIYVVMSRTWQPGQAQRWEDLTGRVKRLNPGEVLELVREI